MGQFPMPSFLLGLRTMALWCILIMFVLEVTYIKNSGSLDFKKLVGMNQFKKVNAWFNDSSEKEKILQRYKISQGEGMKDKSFTHRSKFASIKVIMKETNLKFVLNNKRGKGMFNQPSGSGVCISTRQSIKQLRLDNSQHALK